MSSVKPPSRDKKAAEDSPSASSSDSSSARDYQDSPRSGTGPTATGKGKEMEADDTEDELEDFKLGVASQKPSEGRNLANDGSDEDEGVGRTSVKDSPSHRGLSTRRPSKKPPDTKSRSSHDTIIALHHTLEEAAAVRNHAQVTRLCETVLIPYAKRRTALHPVIVLSITLTAKQHPDAVQSHEFRKLLIKLLSLSVQTSGKTSPRPGPTPPHGSHLNRLPSERGVMTDQLPSPTAQALACNLLLFVLDQSTQPWPSELIQAWIDDALGRRVWVDDPTAEPFVAQVLTAFSGDIGDKGSLEDSSSSRQVPMSRFSEETKTMYKEKLLAAIKERLAKYDKAVTGGIYGPLSGGNPNSNPIAQGLRQLLQVLASVMGLQEVRELCVRNMETWLQNPTLKAQARDILMKLVQHTSGISDQDVAIVDALLNLRLKSSLWGIHVEAIIELIHVQPQYLRRVLKFFISRERTSNLGKRVDIMKVFVSIFRSTRQDGGANANSLQGLGSSPSTSPGRISPAQGTPSLTASSPLRHFLDPSAATRSPAVPTTPLADRSNVSGRSKKKEHPGSYLSFELARSLRDLALTKDLAPILRPVAKKIIKNLGFSSLDILSFCSGLMHDEEDPTVGKLSPEQVHAWLSLCLELVLSVVACRATEIHTSHQLHSQGSARGKPRPVPTSQRFPRTQTLANARPSPAQPSPVHASPIHPSLETSSPDVNSLSTWEREKGSTFYLEQVREEFNEQLSIIQTAGMQWVGSVWVRLCGTNLGGGAALSSASSFFTESVRKLLLLDQGAIGEGGGAIIGDPDWVHVAFCVEGTPVTEETLETLLNLSLQYNLISHPSALSMVETLVSRAYQGQNKRDGKAYDDSRPPSLPGLVIKNHGIVQRLLMLSALNVRAGVETTEAFNLSDRHLFWRCCLLLHTLSTFNPSTVGKLVWDNFPSVRLMLEMSIAKSWDFPPLNQALDNEKRQALLDADTSISLKEAHIVQDMRERQNPMADKVMLLLPPGPARRPPDWVMEALKEEDRKLRLGMRLRRSVSPNFLAEMVGDTSALSCLQRSALWLANVIKDEADTVQILPVPSICELLMLAVGDLKEGGSQPVRESYALGFSRPSLAMEAPYLLERLRLFIQKNSDSPLSLELIRAFLRKMGSKIVIERKNAAEILDALLTNPEESLQEDSLALETGIVRDQLPPGYNWIRNLSSLFSPSFYRELQREILATLQDLLFLETSPESLLFQLEALDAHCKILQTQANTMDFEIESFEEEERKSKRKKYYETELLAAVVSKVLVHRSAIMTNILRVDKAYALVLSAISRSINASYVAGKPLSGAKEIDKKEAEEDRDMWRIVLQPIRDQEPREVAIQSVILRGAIFMLSLQAPCPESALHQFQRLARCLFPPSSLSFAVPSGTIPGFPGAVDANRQRVLSPSLCFQLARTWNEELLQCVMERMDSLALLSLQKSYGLTEKAFRMLMARLDGDIEKPEQKARMTDILSPLQNKELALRKKLYHAYQRVYSTASTGIGQKFMAWLGGLPVLSRTSPSSLSPGPAESKRTEWIFDQLRGRFRPSLIAQESARPTLIPDLESMQSNAVSKEDERKEVDDKGTGKQGDLGMNDCKLYQELMALDNDTEWRERMRQMRGSLEGDAVFRLVPLLFAEEQIQEDEVRRDWRQAFRLTSGHSDFTTRARLLTVVIMRMTKAEDYPELLLSLEHLLFDVTEDKGAQGQRVYSPPHYSFEIEVFCRLLDIVLTTNKGRGQITRKTDALTLGDLKGWPVLQKFCRASSSALFLTVQRLIDELERDLPLKLGPAALFLYALYVEHPNQVREQVEALRPHIWCRLLEQFSPYVSGLFSSHVKTKTEQIFTSYLNHLGKDPQNHLAVLRLAQRHKLLVLSALNPFVNKCKSLMDESSKLERNKLLLFSSQVHAIAHALLPELFHFPDVLRALVNFLLTVAVRLVDDKDEKSQTALIEIVKFLEITGRKGGKTMLSLLQEVAGSLSFPVKLKGKDAGLSERLLPLLSGSLPPPSPHSNDRKVVDVKRLRSLLMSHNAELVRSGLLELNCLEREESLIVIGQIVEALIDVASREYGLTLMEREQAYSLLLRLLSDSERDCLQGARKKLLDQYASWFYRRALRGQALEAALGFAGDFFVHTDGRQSVEVLSGLFQLGKEGAQELTKIVRRQTRA